MGDCPVCVETLTSGRPTCRLPGCGHEFHVSCALDFAQYNVRCPVCRSVPTGVKVRDVEESTSMVVVVRHPPTPSERQLDLERRALDRLYRRRCRQVWETDPQIVAMRRRVSAAQPREYGSRHLRTWSRRGGRRS